MKRLYFAAAAMLLAGAASAQTTYTWNNAVGGDFAVAANWTPARSTPAATDVLVFDGDIAGTAVIAVTNVTTQSVAGLEIVDGAKVTLSAGAANQDITIAEATADGAYDFVVGANSVLRVTGANRLGIVLTANTEGQVSGDVVLAATAASVLNRILSAKVDGLVVESGGSIAMAPSGAGAGGAFGNSVATGAPVAVANGVRFKAGSTFYGGGQKDGTFNGGTGTNPFILAIPDSAVVFDPGSTYDFISGIGNFTGRTYANITWRGRTSTSTGGASPVTITGNLRVIPGTSTSAMTFATQTGDIVIGGDFFVDATSTGINLNPAPTTAQIISIAGNVEVQDASKLTAPADVDTTIVFNGVASQNLDFSGDSLLNVSVTNAAGVVLTDNLTITGNLNLTGDITTGVSTLTLGSAAVVSGAGKIVGNVARTTDATVTGVRTIPVGTTPVTVDITAAGTGTGTLAASTTASAGANLPVGATGINRTWDITATGLSGFTATVTLAYLDGDLGAANEANLKLARFNGSTWDVLPTTVNTTNNTATATGVTAFSTWTLLEEPAASVTDWSVF